MTFLPAQPGGSFAGQILDLQSITFTEDTTPFPAGGGVHTPDGCLGFTTKFHLFDSAPVVTDGFMTLEIEISMSIEIGGVGQQSTGILMRDATSLGRFWEIYEGDTAGTSPVTYSVQRSRFDTPPAGTHVYGVYCYKGFDAATRPPGRAEIYGGWGNDPGEPGGDGTDTTAPLTFKITNLGNIPFVKYKKVI